jgi:hypothetical protein
MEPIAGVWQIKCWYPEGNNLLLFAIILFLTCCKSYHCEALVVSGEWEDESRKLKAQSPKQKAQSRESFCICLGFKL